MSSDDTTPAEVHYSVSRAPGRGEKWRVTGDGIDRVFASVDDAERFIAQLQTRPLLPAVIPMTDEQAMAARRDTP